MIEIYAFLAMFAAQIVAMSVIAPASFIRYVREQALRHPEDVARFAQFYPGTDLDAARERFLVRYRAGHLGIAVLGLLLLGWLFTYMQRPDWDNGPVVGMVSAYAFVQTAPLLLVGWISIRFKARVLQSSAPDTRRKASLQRRGLLDYVSPLTVSLAAFGYLSFAAAVIYAEQHASEFAGFKPWLGTALLAALTLTYVLIAATTCSLLYGKKINPIETRADYLHTISLSVKSSVYACIAAAAFFLLLFMLVLLDLDRWQPFALSTYLVICTLLSLMGLMARPHHAAADGLRSGAVL